MRRLTLFVAMALAVSACGGEASESTVGSTGAPPTDPPATSAPAAVTPAETTTTTGAVADDSIHPAFGDGVAWEDIWPEDGATAVYQVVPFPDATAEVEARIEYGVEYRGETVDRLVFGSETGGERGLVVYFDRSIPWVMRVVASEVYATNTDDGPSYVERFAGGMPFDGRHEVGQAAEFDGTMLTENADGTEFELDIGYRLTTLAVDATQQVPFGPVDGLLHLGVQVGFPEVGDFDFNSELWIHPDLFLVRMTGSPSWRDIQLVTPFS